MSREALEYNNYTGPIFEKWKKEKTAFVETGTNFADGVYTAIRCGFTKIASVENNQELFDEACEKLRALKDEFGDRVNLSLYYGRSEDHIADMLSKVDEPAVLWLDAHNDDHHSVTLSELNIIKNLNINNHTIIIDDVPYFGNHINECKDIIRGINSNYKFVGEETIEKDYVLVAYV